MMFPCIGRIVPAGNRSLAAVMLRGQAGMTPSTVSALRLVDCAVIQTYSMVQMGSKHKIILLLDIYIQPYFFPNLYKGGWCGAQDPVPCRVKDLFVICQKYQNENTTIFQILCKKILKIADL